MKTQKPSGYIQLIVSELNQKRFINEQIPSSILSCQAKIAFLSFNYHEFYWTSDPNQQIFTYWKEISGLDIDYKSSGIAKMDDVTKKVYERQTYSKTIQVFDYNTSIAVSYNLGIVPTSDPTFYPTMLPTTSYPSEMPTLDPSLFPTVYPSIEPTLYPTELPTMPTMEPTANDGEAQHTTTTQTETLHTTTLFPQHNNELHKSFWIFLCIVLSAVILCIMAVSVVVIRQYKIERDKEVSNLVDQINQITVDPVQTVSSKPVQAPENIENVSEIVLSCANDNDLVGKPRANTFSNTITPTPVVTKGVHAVIKEVEDETRVETWLQSIGFAQYLKNFQLNGYDSLDFIKEIYNVSELIDIDITDEQDKLKLLNEIVELRVHDFDTKGSAINDSGENGHQCDKQ